MSRLTKNNKNYLDILAKGGEMFSRGILDTLDLLAELQSGDYGPVIVARFATAGAVTLASTGLTALDGVTPAAGDICLVKNQVAGAQNGLYVASASAWTRLKDGAGNDVIQAAMLVSVAEGTVNADTIWSLTTNAPITVGTTALTFAQGATTALGASLLSTAHGAGASLIGIEDSAGLITAADVEDALAELVKYECVNLADPGTGVAIPVTRSAYVGITSGGSGETNTLAIPTFIGQKMLLNMDTFGGGNRVVTSAQALNLAGNTVMTFGAAREYIMLVAIKVGGALRWTVVSNDGVTLS